jgi:RHS repeat-associated protein
MKAPISVKCWRSPRGAFHKNINICKKLTALLLAFLFFVSPLVRVSAQEAGGDVVTTPPATDTTTPTTPPDPTNSPTDVVPTTPDTTVTPTSPDVAPTADAGITPDPTADTDPSASKLSPKETPQTMSSSEDATPTIGKIPVSSVSLPLLNKANGGLVYDYPIQIPPGRNGFQPNLSLHYDSQDIKIENADFGYGWSIGIPYIERVNKAGENNLYSGSSTMAFFESSLSGELVPVASSSTSFIPRVDNGSFLQYTFSGNQWTVTDKQGNQYQFGFNASARQDNPSDSSQIFKWMLEKQIDANGNTITYSYYKDAGQIYPSTIDYIGNGSTSEIFDISFSRSALADQATSTALGFPVKNNYSITEIDANISSVLTQKYILSYTTASDSSISLLSSIGQSGKDSQGNWTTLPNVQFNYQYSAAKGWTGQTSTWIAPIDLRQAYVVDINGDGLPDIFTNSQYDYPYSTSSVVYLHNGTGWTQSTSWTVPVILFETNPNWGIVSHNVQAVDVNGDGLIDLIDNSGTYINTGSGWTASSTWASPVGFYNSQAPSSPILAFTSDINGDGLPDIIYQYNTGGARTTNIYINTGSGWTQDSSWNFPNTQADINYKVNLGLSYIFDVNGDGLADIVEAYSVYDPYHPGSYVRNTYINNGHGWDYDPVWAPPIDLYYYQYSGYQPSGVQIADVNGDGLLDFSSGYINNGHGWTGDSSWAAGGNGSHIVDANGDGMLDVVIGYYQHSWEQQFETFLNNSPKVNLLSKITYPAGGSTTVSYKGTGQYTQSGSASANDHLPMILDTVSQITTSDGSATSTVDQYYYKGGAYYYNNAFDRKLGGFGKIIDTDAVGNVTASYYHTINGTDSTHGEYQDNYWKAGQQYRVEAYDNAGNLYKKIISKWDSSTSTANSLAGFAKPVQNVESDYDGTANHKDKAESYSYNNTNGNQTQKIQWGEVSAGDDGSFTDAGSDDFTTNFTYASSTGNSIVALPSDVVETDHNSNKVKESRYYYDNQSFGVMGSKGNLTKQEDWKSGSTYVNSQKAYDGTYGLVTQTTDPRGKNTSYSYDSYHLYPTTVTNPLSQVIGYTYNYVNGKVIQTTDPNSLVFSNTYDGLGRITQIQQPDLSSPSTLVVKTAYAYTDTSGAVSVHKTDYLDGSNTVNSYVYYDGLNRAIQQKKSAEDGSTYTANDYAYNNRGLLKKESLPYFNSVSSKTSATNDSTLYTTYSYDALQRATSTVNSVGTVYNNYDNWKVTTTDLNGKNKVYYYDVYNNLVKVDEQTGSGGSPGGLSEAGLINDANLVAYYPLEGNSTDSKGSFNGTDSNISYDSSSGKFGQGASFNGNSSQIQLGSGSVITSSNALWFHAWVYFTALPANNGVVNLFGPAAWNGYGKFMVQVPNDTGKTYYSPQAYTTGSPTGANSPVALSAGQWYMMDIVWDVTNNKYISYLNGSLDVNVSGSGFSAINTGVEYLGSFQASSRWFNGYMDDVAFFDRVPTQNDITNLYNAQGTSSTPETYSTLYIYNGLSNLTQLTDAAGNVRNFTYDGLGRRLTAEDLHASGDSTYGSYSYTYDDSGNLTQKVDPKSQTINYTYDDINRPLTENYTGLSGIEVNYVYDTCTNGVGRLCTAVNNSATTTTTSYNSLGLASSETKTINSNNYQTSYTYDRQGKIVTITNPDSSQVKYTYNSAGQVYTVQRKESADSGFTDVVSSIEYGPNGKPTVTTYANGAVTTNTYDSTKLYRLTHKVTTAIATESRSLMALPSRVKKVAPKFLPPTEEIAPPVTATSTPITATSTQNFITSSTTPIQEATVTPISLNSQSTGFSLGKVYNALASGVTNAAKFVLGLFMPKTAYASGPTELYQTSLYNDSNLKAYYRMEGNSTDSKGSFNGTDSNMSYGSGNGKFGQGASFNGSNSQIQLGSGSIITSSNALWFHAWVYFTALPALNGVVNFVGPSSWSCCGRFMIQVPNSGTTNYSVQLYSNGSPYGLTSTVNLQAGQWYMIDAVWDVANGKITLYTNGVLDTSVDGSGYGTINTGVEYLGSFQASNRWFNGYMDDVAFFDRAPTDSDIAELYGVAPTTYTIQDLTYTYDKNGNITHIADASETDSAKEVTYVYDDLNRFTNASSTGAVYGGNYNYSYAYDALGNILSRNENGTVTNYTYATSTSGYYNPDAAIHIGTATSTWDSNGNLLTDGTRTNTWDYRNQLTQVVMPGINATSTFSYDAFGQRVKMSVATTSSVTTYYPNKYYNITSSTPTKNIFLPDGTLIATVTGAGASSTVDYIHTDHLGSMNVATNDSPAVSQLEDYLPYGGSRINEQNGFNSSRQFIGEIYDPTDGLNYLNARYYNNNTGQFISQDPVFLALGDSEKLGKETSQDLYAVLSDPQSLNSYSYAKNNPLINKDSEGKYAELSASITVPGRTFSIGLRFDWNGIDGFIGGGFGMGLEGGLQMAWAPGKELSHEGKSTINTSIKGAYYGGLSVSDDVVSYHPDTQKTTGPEKPEVSIVAPGMGASVSIENNLSTPLYVWGKPKSQVSQSESLGTVQNNSKPFIGPTQYQFSNTPSYSNGFSGNSFLPSTASSLNYKK